MLSGSRVFSVLNDWETQFRPQPKRFAHDFIAQDGLAIVRDSHRPSPLQGAIVSEHGAFAGLGSRGDWEHIDRRSAFRLLQPGHPLRRIDHRLGVGHAADRTESAGGGGRRAGSNGFFVRLPRLTQVDMQIYKPRGYDQSAGVKLFLSRSLYLARRSNFSNLAIAQQKIHGRVDAGGGVNQVSALDQQAVAALSQVSPLNLAVS